LGLFWLWREWLILPVKNRIVCSQIEIFLIYGNSAAQKSKFWSNIGIIFKNISFGQQSEFFLNKKFAQKSKFFSKIYFFLSNIEIILKNRNLYPNPCMTGTKIHFLFGLTNIAG